MVPQISSKTILLKKSSHFFKGTVLSSYAHIFNVVKRVVGYRGCLHEAKPVKLVVWKKLGKPTVHIPNSGQGWLDTHVGSSKARKQTNIEKPLLFPLRIPLLGLRISSQGQD